MNINEIELDDTEPLLDEIKNQQTVKDPIRQNLPKTNPKHEPELELEPESEPNKRTQSYDNIVDDLNKLKIELLFNRINQILL